MGGPRPGLEPLTNGEARPPVVTCQAGRLLALTVTLEAESLPPSPQRYAGLFRRRLKHGLSMLSIVIVTRMASIVVFAITTFRATPFRMSVMSTSPVMAVVVAAFPVSVGRSVDPRIKFPSRLDDDGWSHSYAWRRDHEWYVKVDFNFSMRLANDAYDAEQQR